MLLESLAAEATRNLNVTPLSPVAACGVFAPHRMQRVAHNRHR
jgi:hypothetical protein